MNLSVRRAVAAAATSVALVAPAAMIQTADAAPPEHSKSAGKKPAKEQKAKKSQTKQLVKAVTVRDKRLARLATAKRTTRLGDENEAAVVANITVDREVLADLKSEAQSAETTLDTRAVRRELRSFRVQNYVLVANVLRKAERLEAVAVADPEAVAFLASAVEKARAVTAVSPKADVKAARADLRAAQAELEPEEDPEDPEVPEDPEA